MHNIYYITYAENADRRRVMADIAEHASEDGDGYSSRMTWHDNLHPFATEELARKFIESVDNGWYDDHAVRFYDFSAAEKTAKIKEYEGKVAELLRAEKEYRDEHSVRKFQAKFVGCPKCGSKLCKDYIRNEKCPLCGTDLRSKTTLDKIAWYQQKRKEYQDRIEAEKQKQKSKCKIKWLVKYEYHS